MTTRTTAQRLVDRSVQGDLEAFDELQGLMRGGMPELDDASHTWTLTPAAVRDVLTRLGSGEVSPELINRWAWFMRRGYVPGRSHRSIRGLEIDYTPEAEDDIAHILARLAELGDLVDGEIDGEELAELKASLDTYR